MYILLKIGRVVFDDNTVEGNRECEYVVFELNKSSFLVLTYSVAVVAVLLLFVVVNTIVNKCIKL